MKRHIKLIGNVIFLLGVSCCCNQQSAKIELSRKLDQGDVPGAIKIIDETCVSQMPRIGITKATLLFYLSLHEQDRQERLRLKEGAVRLLKTEATNGASSAAIILDCYEKQGDVYLEGFPWGGLLGPSIPKGQKRCY